MIFLGVQGLKHDLFCIKTIYFFFTFLHLTLLGHDFSVAEHKVTQNECIKRQL